MGYVLAGIAVIVLLLLLGGMMELSGEASQQEREEYQKQHGRWPNW